MLATLLAGCTSFPATSHILAEFQVGELGPGALLVHNFSVEESWDFLFVGFRTGDGEHVHAVLRTPAGVRLDTSSAEPAGGCAATRPAMGTWSLEVATDSLDGRLAGGKFTVRGARGALPEVLPCTDDVFPGRGRNVTLAWWHATLQPGENTTLGFDQPLELDRLEAGVINATANVTLVFAPPDGEAQPATGPLYLPPRGRWSLFAEVPANGTQALVNGTLFVRGWG